MPLCAVSCAANPVNALYLGIDHLLTNRFEARHFTIKAAVFAFNPASGVSLI
jgi:hypothetical protein